VQDSLLVSVFPPDFTTSARDFSKTEKIGIWPQPTVDNDYKVTRLGEFWNLGGCQCDQIGRIFACWPIVCFGQVYAD
jgi:hypothetical protein